MRRVVALFAAVAGCRSAAPGAEAMPAPDVPAAVSRRDGAPDVPLTPPPAARGETVATFTTPSGERAAFRLEVVDTPAARERGLMYRRDLAPDAGMVFVFPAPEVQSFWMKNTYVPLDMVFVGPDLRVVGVVEDARPLTLDLRSVPVPAQYVVELRAGTARSRGIVAGTVVRFSPPLPPALE